MQIVSRIARPVTIVHLTCRAWPCYISATIAEWSDQSARERSRPRAQRGCAAMIRVANALRLLVVVFLVMVVVAARSFLF